MPKIVYDYYPQLHLVVLVVGAWLIYSVSGLLIGFLGYLLAVGFGSTFTIFATYWLRAEVAKRREHLKEQVREIMEGQGVEYRFIDKDWGDE